MMSNQTNTGLEREFNEAFDSAVETLRKARTHLHEPQARESLRELGAKLGYLSQAMAWQDNGDFDEANRAFGLAQGRSVQQQDEISRLMDELFWCGQP